MSLASTFKKEQAGAIFLNCHKGGSARYQWETARGVGTMLFACGFAGKRCRGGGRKDTWADRDERGVHRHLQAIGGRVLWEGVTTKKTEATQYRQREMGVALGAIKRGVACVRLARV